MQRDSHLKISLCGPRPANSLSWKQMMSLISLRSFQKYGWILRRDGPVHWWRNGSLSMWKYINGILFSHKKWNSAFCSDMDGPRYCHVEWSKTKKNIIWYRIYVESKCIVQMNIFTKQSYNVENKLWLSKGKGGGRINWEIRADTYILLYIK